MKQTNKNNILLKRTLLSFGVLTFIRLGTFLPVPGIDHGYLSFYIQQHSLTRNLTSTFTGNDICYWSLYFKYISIYKCVNNNTIIDINFSKFVKITTRRTSEGRRTINK